MVAFNKFPSWVGIVPENLLDWSHLKMFIFFFFQKFQFPIVLEKRALLHFL